MVMLKRYNLYMIDYKILNLISQILIWIRLHINIRVNGKEE